MLHTLEALAQAVAAEIEDEFTNPEAGIGGNVLDHLFGGARERSALQATLALGGQRHIIRRVFVGDRRRCGVAARGLCQALGVPQRAPQPRRPQWPGRIGAPRMPTIAIPRGPPQGGATMATDPDRGMWLLHRMWQA